MQTAATQLTGDITEFELERYVLELESDGLTILPPEVTGVTPDLIDRCTEVLCRRFEEMTGLPGLPSRTARWANWSGSPRRWRAGLLRRQREAAAIDPDDHPADPAARPLHPGPRRHPVVDALIDHLMGPSDFLGAAAGGQGTAPQQQQLVRQMQGDYGYGPGLALHCDQGLNPLPGADGAHGECDLVSHGLHTRGRRARLRPGFAPVERPPRAAEGGRARETGGSAAGIGDRLPGHDVARGVPEKDSRTAPVRRTILSATSRSSHRRTRAWTFLDTPWEDCADPDRMRELIGFDDTFPYLEQNQAVPRLAATR